MSKKKRNHEGEEKIQSNPECVSEEPNQIQQKSVQWQEQIQQLLQEKEMVSDQLLRTAAEYDNFRKRTQREKEQLYGDSLVEVTKQWLPLLDNIERGYQIATQGESQDQSSLLEGLNLIRKQAQEILVQLGVEQIPALGETFDPEVHEAVFQIEDPQYGEQEVIEVLVTGYRKGERILRHAVVKVAN